MAVGNETPTGQVPATPPTTTTTAPAGQASQVGAGQATTTDPQRSDLGAARPGQTSPVDDDLADVGTWTVERALHELAKTRREAAEHRTARRALEVAQQEAERAKLSREDQLAAALADRERELTERALAYQERLVSSEVRAQAAQLGIIDPDAAARLLDQSQIEYAEDGAPKNLNKLLKALIADKPYLAPGSGSNGTGTGAQTPGQPMPPTLRATNAPTGAAARSGGFSESQIASMTRQEYLANRVAIFRAQREGRILPG